MEAKPLRIVPSSHNNTSGEGGGGPQKNIEMGHRTEGGVVVDEGKSVVLFKEEKNPSFVELDLGVGAHTAPLPEAINPLITACHYKCCLFTEAQRRELDHQVSIFNHFAYNLPLPHHLVLPVFNTAAAAATLDSGFHKQFPSYMSEYNRDQGFDYGKMVDPELHRCRRTDGKKWRCSRNVVPDQKYCERHMHRGRNRSRKPVETSQVNSPLITKPSGKFHTKLASNTESAVSNPNPLGIQSIDTSSCTPSRSHCVVNTSSTNNRLKNIIGSADYYSSFSPVTVESPGSTLTTAIAPKVTTFSSVTSVVSDNRSSLNVSKKDNQTKSCINNNVNVKSGGKGSIICDGNSISTRIGFSPRSVLQVSGCNNSYLNDTNSIELEPGRCRRTDGKKWRCKSAVLPSQKYCATHMHRGAKRRFADHESATTPSSAVTIARLPYSTTTANIQKAYCTIPNTKLSMSIPASAPLIQCDEKSPSSSDTDTTITDTMHEYSCASF